MIERGHTVSVLNAGYVQLVDWMGSDERICDAARVSYADATKRSNDRNLIRYMLSHGHCYDDKTEVLTTNGFKSWADVNESDALGVYDPTSDSLKYEVPAALQVFDYDGSMVVVDHGGVSLCVTPNHKMWVSSREGSDGVWGPHRLVEANNLVGKSMIRFTAQAPLRPTAAETIDWPIQHTDKINVARLIGFFIGDGSVGSKNTIQFHLKKQRKVEFLKQVCDALNISLTANNNRYAINYPNIGEVFRRLFYGDDKKKQFPQNMVALSSIEIALAFLDGLKNSDGSVKRTTWCYSTNSRFLANQVQQLVIHAGNVASLNENAKGLFTLNVHSRMTRPIVNQTNKEQVFLETYVGKVYCATTSTGVLVVRRNNKVVLCGNSSPFEQCVVTFRAKMPIFVARQWVRHRTARLNEISGRYSELPAEYYNYSEQGLPKQSQTNNQGSDIEKVQAEGNWMTNLDAHNQFGFQIYSSLLQDGCSKEIARCHLPLSTYTEWYWQCDLHNLFHFIRLRMDPHAQAEIRVYAEAMYEMIKELFPLACEAFEDYVLNAMTFSAMEQKALAALMVPGGTSGTLTLAEENERQGWQLSKRELEEFENKLARLGYH
jgi:thymidylate synthase (FAD)